METRRRDIYQCCQQISTENTPLAQDLVNVSSYLLNNNMSLENESGNLKQNLGSILARELAAFPVKTATARQIYGSIYLQRNQTLTSRSINPCSKGKMSL
jgi:hypothetical protein